MVYTNVNSSFPSQVVPDVEKNTYDYGLAVGRAIENEWFRGDKGLGAGGRFGNNWQDFHRLRLYARGEQSVAKYKDELSINGDLSYLNLDWKPVAVLSKPTATAASFVAEFLSPKVTQETFVLALDIPMATADGPALD